MESKSDDDVDERNKVLQEINTKVDKAAAFLDDINDADIIGLVRVAEVDSTYAHAAVTITRHLHDFEAAIKLFSNKLLEGSSNPKIAVDSQYLLERVMEDLNLFSMQADNFEVSKAARQIEDMSKTLDTENDKNTKRIRQQLIIMETGVLSRFFWLLRAPIYFGIPISTLKKNRFLWRIHLQICNSICGFCAGNEVVQDYVARSSYSGFRSVSTTEFGSFSEIGFVTQVMNNLYFDEEGASRILESVVSSNRTLLGALFTNEAIEMLIDLIIKRGAKPSLLRLLASTASAQEKPMFHNQSLLSNLVYSNSEDQRYLQNRKVVLIETAVGFAKCHTHGLDMIGCDQKCAVIYISWFGVPAGVKMNNVNAALFCDVASLKLSDVSVVDSEIDKSPDLIEYRTRAGIAPIDCKWVDLVSIGWLIDPQNCFKYAYVKGEVYVVLSASLD